MEFGMVGVPYPSRDTTRGKFNPIVRYAPGYYYGSAFNIGFSTQTYTQNRMYGSPFPVFSDVVVDRLYLLTIATASASWRIGFYADEDGLPGNLICDFGSVDGTATAGVEAASLATLPMGQNWIAWVPQGANGQARSMGAGSQGSNWFIPSTSGQSQNNLCIYNANLTVSGELPSYWGTSPDVTTDTKTIQFGYRVAAVL